MESTFQPSFSSSFESIAVEPPVILQKMAAAVGTISKTVSVYLAANSDRLIDWGDDTTSVVSAGLITEYSHTYVSSLNPEISIDDPTGITEIALELGVEFFIDFTNDLKKSIFNDLVVFTMTDVSNANWIGNPYSALLDCSIFT